MRITDLLEQAARNTREVKEWACRNGPDDIHPEILVFRDGEPVAMVTMRDHDPTEVIQIAGVCAVGFDADVLTMMLETYKEGADVPTNGINPVTNREWAGGEMQIVAQNHDGIAKGWVSEAVLTVVGTREGRVASSIQRFSYDDNKIVWGKSSVAGAGDENAESLDPFSEAMLAIMSLPVASGFPLSDEEFPRYERDILTTMFLARTGTDKYAVCLYADVSDEQRVAALNKIGVLLN